MAAIRKGQLSRRPLAVVISALLVAGASLATAPAWAQSESEATKPKTALAQPAAVEDVELERTEVIGLRQTVQSSIATKRESAMIVDAISSKEIGGLPATSVGEAIETITGASTHREKGGATEIAIRGLGPFLGGATFNGREASNGSGDRSVNFNQFPSELINSITIYKTQQASLIEGAVSGQIELETLKPLDYGKRLLQFEAEANSNEYQSRISDGDDYGSRGIASYVDQFRFGDGELGVSLGVQRNSTNNPEEVYTSSSTWVACDPARPSSATANCNQIVPGSTVTDFYTAAGSHALRQISEDDQRDAQFAAFQLRPNADWEFNLDYQHSKREFNETRQDLNFSETLRGITNPIYSDSGVLLAYSGNSSIESTSTYRTQTEEYEGGGLNVEWRATDALTLKADLSVSETTRVQQDRSVRLRSDPLDIFGVATANNNQRVNYTYDARNGNVPTITVDPRFDVNDFALFSDDARLRRDEQFQNNTIDALRLDGNWIPAASIFNAVDFGIRYSELAYNNYDDRVEITQDNRAVDARVNQACRIPFPQSSFLSNDSGNVISSWATFDPRCQYLGYLGTEDPGRNADVTAIANNDIEEQTRAAYVMASFGTQVGNIPMSGNFGVRAVQTKVASNGLRSDITIRNNPDGSISLVEVGDFTTVQINTDYDRLLPSLNLTFELKDDLLLRGGVFRAMSRPDPSALGAGRAITLNNGESFTSVEDAIGQITATGSPSLKPLMSWNADLSLEFYPNPDSIVAAALYYKRFEGGFENAVFNEDFNIDGQSITVPVVQEQNSGRSSTIRGLELSGAYRFSTLPQPFDGLGVKMGYNYASSNFETQDIRLGNLTDPLTGSVTPGLIPPADIFGLSKHVLSTQLFWTLGDLELQAIYKYRSNYYQKFVGAPSQLRYVEDVESTDLRASYRLNKHVSFQAEAINVFDEPKVTYMPVQGSIREYNTYGARYYLGVQVRF